MDQTEIISGKDLIKRLNIPPYALLDDLRYRGKFCPRNKKTGTPIPPPGRESELKVIKKLEKIVSKKEIALETAVSDMDLKKRYEARVEHRAQAHMKGIEAELNVFRSQLTLLIHQVGYPFRMWERYSPADEEEKGRAIDVLLSSHFWVRFAEGANPALEAKIAAYDAGHSRQPVNVAEVDEAFSGNNSPPKLATPATNAEKMRQSKYFNERKLFERFLKDDWHDPGTKGSTISARIRRAKRKMPVLAPVPDGRMRKWYKKIVLD